MRFGLQVSRFETWDGPAGIGPAFRDVARRADEAGFASLWVMDHLFQIPRVGPPEENMLEAYAALAVAAGVTRRARLGALVTAVTYRHPGMLIKTVTTLDALSGGRAWLGIGAGWYEAEARGLGLPFPPLAERFERLEEALQIARRMWSGDESPFHGKHYDLERPMNRPPAVRAPRPPILVGGGGERKTLRLVARYADACNLFAGDLDALAHKLDVLRGHCADVGRNYDEIEKTVLGPPILPEGKTGERGLTPEQGREFVGKLRGLGIQHYICSTGIDQSEAIETIAAEVMPRFPEA